MEWTVRLTRRAEEDLEEIVRHIARDNLAAAEKFGRAILSRVESWSRQPGMGIAVRNWKDIRALLHRKYYFVYHYDSPRAEIKVLRFWHSARDLGLLRIAEPGDPEW
jgi:plasmid stabilization system protein ParE